MAVACQCTAVSPVNLTAKQTTVSRILTRCAMRARSTAAQPRVMTSAVRRAAASPSRARSAPLSGSSSGGICFAQSAWTWFTCQVPDPSVHGLRLEHVSAVNAA
jgi:hypothetical protein